MASATRPASAPLDPWPAAGAVLVDTKLQPPAGRTKHVPRAEVLEHLRRAERPTLTLVAAPAGWGKTTLLGEWCAEGDRVAWLSLDTSDNDPVRFWTYVVEALRTVEPDVGDRALALLRAPHVSIVDVVLPELLNELGRLERPLNLVLDDYHFVADAGIHESFTFLIDHLPETVFLLVATRSDPPLPIGRLRAQGDLVEVRAESLRFNKEEAAALLNGALGLELGLADVGRLLERTEGWAAGLYLAALSLYGRADPGAFIAAFAGDDRHIVDYLGAEVLDGQPEPVRVFLLRTSILERLSGPLCDAVTGDHDSARMLERIERSNLFLVPLDPKREWYRYHHLFGELLRHELERTEPGLVLELHRRASDWFRAEGSVPEAIHHAAGGGDVESARELTALHWNRFFNQGRQATVAGWLDALPGGAVAEDPRLCVARAWMAMDRGQLAEVEGWIAAADAGLLGLRRSEATAPIASDVAVLRAVHRFKAGNVTAAGGAAQQVLALEPGEESFWRTVAYCILGLTHYWAGRDEEAVPVLEEAVRLARLTGNELAAAYALGYLALVRVERGELDGAERLAQEAATLSAEPGFAEHFVLMIGHLAQGRIHERRGELAAADAAMARAVELARRGAGRIEFAAACLALADVRGRRGDVAGKKGLLQDAREQLELCSDPGVVALMLATAERGPPAARRAGDPRGTALREELTGRELEVLRLLRTTLSLREVGATLYVSQNTVKTHTRAIYRKLRVSTREQAVARARELRLL
jgi:LuxR family maltose regulon positive regulatory protein